MTGCVVCSFLSLFLISYWYWNGHVLSQRKNGRIFMLYCRIFSVSSFEFGIWSLEFVEIIMIHRFSISRFCAINRKWWFLFTFPFSCFLYLHNIQHSHNVENTKHFFRFSPKFGRFFRVFLPHQTPCVCGFFDPDSWLFLPLFPFQSVQRRMKNEKAVYDEKQHLFSPHLIFDIRQGRFPICVSLSLCYGFIKILCIHS